MTQQLMSVTWAQALDRLGYVRGTQGLLRLHGRLDAIDGGRVVVRVTPKWLPTVRLRAGAIAIALAEVLGHPVDLALVPDEHAHR